MTDVADQKMQLLAMTSDIVCTYIAQNNLEPKDVSALINDVYASLDNAGGQQVTKKAGSTNSNEPAVPVNESVQKNFIVCLEDGKELKMLKRYLMTNYKMTPEQYRAKWNLPSDYPMVAPSYAKKRSKLAKSIGLGTKNKNKAA